MKPNITDSGDFTLYAHSGKKVITDIQFYAENKTGKFEITRNWHKSCKQLKSGISYLANNKDNVKFSVKAKERKCGGTTLNTELINRSQENFDISSFSMKFFIESGNPEDCLFFHPQNINFVRIQIPDNESYTDERLFKIPDKEYRLGNSEDYALPVLIILNKKKNIGFAIGASTENVFNKEFILKPKQHGLNIEVIQCLRGITEKKVAPEESLQMAGQVRPR